MNNYSISAGSKLEYSATKEGTFKAIKGLLSIPQIGDTPNKIDTTTLDNLKYETNVNGLMPAPELTFPFNMQDPNAEANINVVHGLADGTVYFWKITTSNGITHEYSSSVVYSFDETPTNEIFKFTMYHAPLEEIKTTIPNGSL